MSLPLAGSLHGISVLITRSPDRAGGLVSALLAVGAEPLLLPLIDFEAVDFSVEDLRAGNYSWLVVSSITTVRALKAAAAKIGLQLAELVPPKTRMATIGPSSRRILEHEGLTVHLAPEDIQSAAGLVAILPRLDGNAVWLPQSDVAGPALAEGLRAAGAQVSVTTAYRTVDYPASNRLVTELAVGVEPVAAPMLSLAAARAKIADGSLQAVVAASASAASRIAETLRPLQNTKFIAIGRPTAEQAAAEGIVVAGIAEQPTPEGIVAVLNSVFERDIS
ncbi:uroporphyrinogen-III synthase [Renibacterium salmoninarum]|nr:uroporphyrinogen-III synthase [Renibacterium salmoninarum]